MSRFTPSPRIRQRVSQLALEPAFSGKRPGSDLDRLAKQVGCPIEGHRPNRLNRSLVKVTPRSRRLIAVCEMKGKSLGIRSAATLQLEREPSVVLTDIRTESLTQRLADLIVIHLEIVFVPGPADRSTARCEANGGMPDP